MPDADAVLEGVKARLTDDVERRAALLVDTSHRLHADPELAFEEQRAHDLLCDLLEAGGLQVERHAFGLPTAFAARAGTRGPCIAVCCEYDALPGLGHACGHNIIATAALGAGLAAAAVADEVGGRVVVLGTPAEEGGGGKVVMAEAGAFDGVDAAMMVHPAAADLDAMEAIAIRQLRAEYEGRAAHAAAFPHEGRNALDAAVLGYVNVAALRQHIRSDERVHGVFPRAGDKPNIVPDHTVAEWYVRAGTLERLDALEQRVRACLQAGADAAGCRVAIEETGRTYADLVTNDAMIDHYRANARTRGREVQDGRGAQAVMGSTDMGNVSHLVPSIHPMIQAAPPGVAIHTPEFAVHAAGPDGDRAVVDGAVIMARTIADLWLAPGALGAVRDEFARRVTSRDRTP